MASTELRTTEKLQEDFANLQLLFSISEHIIKVIIRQLNKSQLQELAWKGILDIPILDQETTQSLEICDDAFENLTSLYMSLSELAAPLKIDIDINRNDDCESSGFTVNEAKYILTIKAYVEGRNDKDDISESETFILPRVASFANESSPLPPNEQKSKAEYN